jgi:hypothetical protein
MKSQNMLPMTEPFIDTFSMHANGLSILLNYPDAYPWLMNNFIQIISWHKYLPDYYDFNLRNCPLLNYYSLDKMYLRTKWADNIAGFMMDAIDNGFYLATIVMTGYISAYLGRENQAHGIFIFGYDLDKSEFYIADNFNFGKYAYKTCSFKEMEMAYSSISSEDEEKYPGPDQMKACIEMFSYRKNSDAVFQLSRMKESLTDYLHSRPTHHWYTATVKWVSETIDSHSFGFNGKYDAILDHLINFKHGKIKQIDVRILHVIFEHKSTMVRRLKYLTENKLVHNGEHFLNIYAELEKDTLVCRNILLKSSITKKILNADDLIMKYKEIKASELGVLEKLINTMK